MSQNAECSAERKRGFICGCCGDGFRDTLTAQAEHDQDAGYGICPRCEMWIDERNERDWADIESKVAAALNPQNRAKFLGFDVEVRRGIMWQMMDDGLIQFEIRRT